MHAPLQTIPRLTISQAVDSRPLRVEALTADLVVIGGGIAGTCCAIAAARAGLDVVLLQDRPVIGGNASSEVRLWCMGATGQGYNNNRWAREGGVIDEILVENVYRNPEGNAVLFDTVLLDLAQQESNLRLLLNTPCTAIRKSTPDRIDAVEAFCSINSTRYTITAPLFVDASGDGVVAYQAGAAFRMGAEDKDEFGEPFAPDESFGYLLGDSIYFYSKDLGHPVTYFPPSFALKDVPGRIPRFRRFNARENGVYLWWIEFGGRLDTVHQAEEIKWELWRIVYGVWDYIKNSGSFPDAANLTLEWVGLIPGKRESRRFEGPYMLVQQDIIEARRFGDAVAHGGWSLDLHPADGVYSEHEACTHWQPRGHYQIPYRCLFSRNINNLFLAGRIISCSHVAFASVRNMATLGECGQAVGIAAALCRNWGVDPSDLLQPEKMTILQKELLRRGQCIPQVRLEDPEDLIASASLSASSSLNLTDLPDDADPIELDVNRAQMLPIPKGPVPVMSVVVDSANDTEIEYELRIARSPENFTPDIVLARGSAHLSQGNAKVVRIDLSASVEEDRYVWFVLCKNPAVKVHTSTRYVTGLLNVLNWVEQTPPEHIGVESIPIWHPERRPRQRNFAFRLSTPISRFTPNQLCNGFQRPTNAANAWIAEWGDSTPKLTATWDKPTRIQQVDLTFDTDSDHVMESVFKGHPERAMPGCVRAFRLLDDQGNEFHRCDHNHQSRQSIVLPRPVVTQALHLEFSGTWGTAPVGLFSWRAYSDSCVAIFTGSE